MSNSKKYYFFLTLIRHGETAANVDHIIQGHMDTELSENGIQQARLIREHVKKLPIDILISSDLQRATLTAVELDLPVELELDARLRERNFGTFCGTHRNDLKRFAEQNAASSNGCAGWREVGGECSHEMAQRTSAFLCELCQRLSRTPVGKSHSDSNIFPIFDSPQQPQAAPPMPHAVFPYFHQTTDNSDFIYSGHVAIVSHGGWIRHLLRLLALQAKHSKNFPKKCANSVLKNCGICQVGVAFDYEEIKSFIQAPESFITRPSPIPVFGNIEMGVLQEVRCQHYSASNRIVPFVTICYHFDLDLSQLKSRAGSHVMFLPELTSNPAEELCTRVESIFADDDDEYAGQADKQ